ncbi:LacI family transcriptional regulator [Lactococcus garvieae]|uniref:LacI family transcriptional regulator n=1 Tax=Lactococcus garvieae TaxID=1363 RepID=A0A6L2ZV85_9LACT|nr:LacI family DNA-binding transcriptional regulator [Lactococcus garvieae]GFO51460.1 LacI family transcriptional regulator [Lactococcus garvieae]
MAVTIKDVAKKAGVNASTVSRVLKDSSEISEKTKIKVRKAMQELGYTRNVAAQILASGKSNTIGVVFPPVEDKSNQPFYMKVLTSINETARKYDVSIAVVTGYQESELKQQVELMYSEKRVDGFIVLYAGKADSVRNYLFDNKIPFVLLGTPTEKQNEITHVDNDNVLMGHEATRYLMELGHSEISFVTDTKDGEVFEERYQGYQDEMLKKQSKPNLLVFEENMTLKNETGLVVMDEVLALKVISRLSEQGVKVPEDVSVITYNNSAFSTLVQPYLTTFDINIVRLGAATVEKFLGLTQNDEAFHDKTIIPFELILRETTAPKEKE